MQTPVFLVHYHNSITPGLGKLHPLQAFLLHEYRPHPPSVGDSPESLPLKGSSSVSLILCFTRFVQPKSPGSKERMSWYSASRVCAVARFRGDHPSRPDKSNCWKSASSLCPTDILDLWIPCIFTSFSNIPGEASTWGIAFTAMTQAILTPLAMVTRAVDRFFTMTATCLLPVVILV